MLCVDSRWNMLEAGLVNRLGPGQQPCSSSPSLLLFSSCLQNVDRIMLLMMQDPNKYGWDNYGYSEDSYSYEGHRYKSKDAPKNVHRKNGGDSPYSKTGDSPYSKGPYSVTG